MEGLSRRNPKRPLLSHLQSWNSTLKKVGNAPYHQRYTTTTTTVNHRQLLCDAKEENEMLFTINNGARVRRRGDRNDLPWQLPVPLERTYWPTPPFCENLRSALLPNAGRRWESSTQRLPLNNMSVATAMPQNEGKGQVCLPGTSSGFIPTNFPTIAFADFKCDARETEMHSTKAKTLPPIGVFWDIENCSVPKGRSALVAVQRIREKFFLGHVEAEFLCVCDIRKESPSVIQELNDAQVSVLHVSSNSKNAADDKLRQAMRRFADTSCANPINSEWLHPATVILITGDINFVADLSDLRYRKRLYIVLLRNKQTPDALLMCAHEQYEFHSLLTDLPLRVGYKEYTENSSLAVPLKGGQSMTDIILHALPDSDNPRTYIFVRNRLRKLSENCGGRVMSIRGQFAVIRFPNSEAAMRATKRMNGEDVLGLKIKVVPQEQMEYLECPEITNLREYFAQTINPMNSNKQNYGMFGGSGSWKPTWNRRPLATDSFRQGSSRHQVAEECKYQNTQSTSSSVETSRDDSPTLMPQNPVPGPSHVNPPSQCHSSHLVNNIGPVSSNPVATHIAFPHHNMYPSMECTMDPQSLLRQEYQQRQSSSYQYHSDPNGASPRLYSTGEASPQNNGSPAQSRGRHSFNNQSDPYFNKPFSSAGNGISSRRNTATPPRKSMAENSFGDPGPNVNGGTENYARHRNCDGESFDLNVTNIDPNIGDWRAIRSALSNAFAEHVNVRSIWVSVGTDGSVTATVKLNSKDEAHFAVAQLHQRRKIGNKRISISFEQGSIDYDTLKAEVSSLLMDVPNHSLPLFKFREMFEKRYKRSVLSEHLYRIKDVVTIAENSPNGSGSSTPTSGRTISLAPNWHCKEGDGLNIYCKFHPPKTQRATDKSRMGWAEKEAEVMLPNVVVEIKMLGTRIHTLLQSHNGGFPLISFLDCYEAEFGALEPATEGNGVPLEHLITCVQGVEIVLGENGMKRVQWHEKKEDDRQGLHQPMAASQMEQFERELVQFGRELIDLLKTFPKCTLPFSKLIPCYHAHFGRQCRVADYGHRSLVALLQTLPHIIQIMGAAQNRVITLAHGAQMKRFGIDMLRVLKSQGGPKKQIRMDDFPSAFLNVFSQRQFQPEDYGLCFFSDLVAELLEHSTRVALVKDEEGQRWLAVPKREQTPNEIYRTRLFAAEVVELLRHSTRCELEFSKFVPYYHHHFQKQCRVVDYGFGKLAELFDAINDTVTIVSPSGNDVAVEDKIIRLTPKEQIKVIGEQVCNIIEKQKESGFSTKKNDLLDGFLTEHGFHLRPELCDASSVDDLIRNKLDCFVKVIGEEIIAVDRVHMEDLSKKAELILQQAEEYTMDIEEFASALREKCSGAVVNELVIEKDLNHVAVVGTSGDGEDGNTVSLSPIRVFAHEMTLLLESKNGSLPLSSLESLYFEKFGRPLRPAQLGYPTVLPMLQAISDIVTVQGKLRTKRMVTLNSVKPPTMETTSDDSSSTYERRTPRSGRSDHWKTKENRYPNSGSSSSRHGKYNDGKNPRRRLLVRPPPLFSPLASPPFPPPRNAEVFTFDRPTPMSPPMYDMWVQESVAPGSPPVSPPVVWTCHPIYYPTTPNASGAGNILVTSPYVAPTPWSPPPMNSNCYDRLPSAQPPTMMGSEYLFGQTHRLAASFEKLGMSGNDGNENEA